MSLATRVFIEQESVRLREIIVDADAWLEGLQENVALAELLLAGSRFNYGHHLLADERDILLRDDCVGCSREYQGGVARLAKVLHSLLQPLHFHLQFVLFRGRKPQFLEQRADQRPVTVKKEQTHTKQKPAQRVLREQGLPVKGQLQS